MIAMTTMTTMTRTMTTMTLTMTTIISLCLISIAGGPGPSLPCGSSATPPPSVPRRSEPPPGSPGWWDEHKAHQFNTTRNGAGELALKIPNFQDFFDHFSPHFKVSFYFSPFFYLSPHRHKLRIFFCIKLSSSPASSPEITNKMGGGGEGGEGVIS